MRNRFDRQLEQLNNELINMGSLIEEAIEMAITALMKQDAKKAKEIVDFDEEIDEAIVSYRYGRLPDRVCIRRLPAAGRRVLFRNSGRFQHCR